jgi:hypothetical protein
MRTSVQLGEQCSLPAFQERVLKPYWDGNASQSERAFAVVQARVNTAEQMIFSWPLDLQMRAIIETEWVEPYLMQQLFYWRRIFYSHVMNVMGWAGPKAVCTIANVPVQGLIMKEWLLQAGLIPEIWEGLKVPAPPRLEKRA